ncbi:MAG: hypothetical protein JWN44_4862 [Myxococcales bacterium]|nr:hypothetical protein [Myxococcales bacterium]
MGIYDALVERIVEERAEPPHTRFRRREHSARQLFGARDPRGVVAKRGGEVGAIALEIFADAIDVLMNLGEQLDERVVVHAARHCEGHAEVGTRDFAQLPGGNRQVATGIRILSGYRIGFRSRNALTSRLVIADFHLIALQLGTEEQMLERAFAALDAVEPGETAFLPEYLAWTPQGAGRAFARLIALAQERDINVITTLNLGPDLLEDLPGRDADARYNALTIFTRHGSVHVPQAKVTPQSFEMDVEPDGPGIGVAPYARINRVRLDWQDALIDARFIICSDVAAFLQLSPETLQCDLLVVVGNFAYGAERVASRLLGQAIAVGAARTAFHVNAFHVPRDPGQRALALKAEEVLDATQPIKAPAAWPNPRSIRSGFYVYEDGAARDFVSMCNLPRRGRVAVPRSRWQTPLSAGEYPVTISL